MERGKTYTENELGEKKVLEEEIRDIFYKDTISDISVIIGNMLLRKWKQLVEWTEDTTPFLIEDKEKEQRDIQELFNKPKTNT